MQKTLDEYGAGVLVQQVQLQKVDPPTQVHRRSFRDVQAARSDLERAQNEAQTYANRIVPEARGRAAKIIQDAEAYQIADRRRRQRPDLALSCKSTSNTRRRPRSRASACIWKPWSAFSAAPTRPSSILAAARRPAGRGALSAAQ